MPDAFKHIFHSAKARLHIFQFYVIHQWSKSAFKYTQTQ